LNKYPVIHNHFIIATKENQPQTNILEEEDLQVTYACLQAWGEHQESLESSRLFCFFNSGEHSGASQPHRHLQFLPVEAMAGDKAFGWNLLMNRMTVPAHHHLPLYHDPSLPFLHFATPLHGNISSMDLYSRYTMLLKAAASAIQIPSKPYQEDIVITQDQRVVFSYNLAITTDRMAICPRSKEACGIPGAGDDSSVAINGTILGGTLMVKNEKEWDSLREDPSVLERILSSIGFHSLSHLPFANPTNDTSSSL
jgi:ATP adenylyltransferase